MFRGAASSSPRYSTTSASPSTKPLNDRRHRLRGVRPHTKSGRRSLGHRAAASTSVRLTDREPIGQLITRATTEPRARVDGPRCQIAAQNPIRLDAAHEAAADGQREARAFAAGVGAKLGRLIRLNEPSTDYAGPRMRQEPAFNWRLPRRPVRCRSSPASTNSPRRST